MADERRFICGVDTGGTFTDCVAIDASGRRRTAKASSTPPHFETGFFAGLGALAFELGLSLEGLLAQTDQLVHGTTVATNALVERRGATVGLLATQGHRDAIFVMRGVGRVAGLTVEQAMRTVDTGKPEPLVAKSRALEVVERIDSEGEVVVALDEAAARETIGTLLESGVDAIAIALLWAFRNPVHERRLKELVEELAPGVHVSVAHEIAPRMGEYERTAAAVIDAYVKPVTVSYLGAIERGCRERGYAGPLLVVQSDGNVAPLDAVVRTPLLTLQSGPAAGLDASRLMGRAAGCPDVLVLDMGGTTCDVGLIAGGVAPRRTTNIISQYEYFTPSVEIESIGVGGGSVAWIDPLSAALRVGPRSAGAVPGPVCYARGGLEPTVTDADVVLGRIDPGGFLGGRMHLDREAADAAIAKLGRSLGLEPHAVAAGISRLADLQIAEEIRKLTVARGYDPRRFTVFAYGGAGPVHAGAVARELGLATVIVPLGELSSLWSAFGAATSDLGVTVELSVSISEPLDGRVLATAIEALHARAVTALERAGVRRGATFATAAGLRYRAQVNEVWVPFEGLLASATERERLVADFESEYEALFGRGTGYREAGIELAALRCVATFPRRVRVDAGEPEPPPYAAPAQRHRTRHVFWAEEGGYVETPVLDGIEVHGEEVAVGPAIVELGATTVVVHPGQHLRRDRFGNLVLESRSAPSRSAQNAARPLVKLGVSTTDDGHDQAGER